MSTPADTANGNGRRSSSRYTLRDLLIAGAYHRHVVAIVFLAALAVGIAAGLLSLRTFTAEGRLLLLPAERGVGVAEMSDVSSLLPFDNSRAAESEIQILKSHDVVLAMVEEIGVEALFPQLARGRLFGLLSPEEPGLLRERAVEIANESIKSTVQTGSNIIRVSFEHENRAVAMRAVDVLVNAYLARRQDIMENLTSPVLVSRLGDYGRQLNDVENDLRDLKIRFGILDLAQEALLAVNQVDIISQRERQLNERREALIAEIANARARIAELPDRVIDFQESTNRVDNDTARARLYALEIERDNLRAKYNENWPRVREVEQELEATRRFMQTQRPNYETQRAIRNPTVEFLTNHLVTIQLEQDGIVRQLDELTRQKSLAERRVAELREAEQQSKELERKRAVLERLYRDLSLRAEAAKVDEQAARIRASNVRVVEWANAPLRGRSLATSFIAAGLMSGLLLAGATGLAAVRNRQVFVVPVEVERALGMPLLGTFNDSPRGFEAPGARMETMAMATRVLDFRRDDRPLKTLQFLATSEREGRSELVVALAAELARGRGLRTLLISLGGVDHAALFGADDRPPTTIGGVDLVPTAVQQLWITRDAGGSALGSQRTDINQVRQSVAALGRQFDVVLIDAPDTSVSQIGMRLAPLVDANIVVVRAETTRAPSAMRLTEEVLLSGGDILGAVFTGRRFYIPQAIYRWL